MRIDEQLKILCIKTDLSLSEIAINLGGSRNAVHKVIQGVEEKLRFYEEKLELYHKSQ